MNEYYNILLLPPPTPYFSDSDVSSISIVVLYEHMCVFVYTHSLLSLSSVVHIYMYLGLAI